MSKLEFISGNVFIRKNRLEKKGDFTEGHKHAFDHTTIVFKGSVRVSATLENGTKIEREFVAPAHVLIKAHVEHLITALEDDSVYWCVYSHRTPQGEVSVEYDGWNSAYQ